MSLKYLNLTGLSNLVSDIKNWVIARIPTKTSEITNDSGFITSSSLPTVNNATLTIQKNGTNVQTFTANASSNKTANITVPTKTSELTNDSGFLSNTLTNNTSKGALGWSSSIGTNIPTLNTIAYWNGAYTNTTSNLAYCVKGAFGDIVTHNASEFASDDHTHNYLPLSGGTLTGNIIYKRSNATRGTAPSSNVTIQHCDVKDSANNRFTLLETTYYTDMSSKIALFAYKTTAASGNNIGSIGIGCTSSGTVYTFAPTPAASDDSTQIATTAYVKNQGYLSGTVPIANGGTGATTRLNAVKALTNENVGTDTDYFLTITSSWGKAGYCSVANAKTVLGLKSAAYTESSAYAAASHTHSQYLTEHQSLSNYSTKANTVKSLSISGKTITVTPGSGSTYTLTTQDTVYTHPTSAGNKHIPSGGSSGQILKYSSSGTAVWADVDFTRKFATIHSESGSTYAYARTTWTPKEVSLTLTPQQPAFISIDITTSGTMLFKGSASNCFVIAVHNSVGSQSNKQDSTTYGTLFTQTSSGRNRVQVLVWPYSSSVKISIAYVSGSSNINNGDGLDSFSMGVYQ